MVRKDKEKWFFVSYKYMLYVAAVASMCAGLVVLQHYCMNHRDGDFVTGYCLTDSHMRAVLAAILTIVGLVLTSSMTSAVEAYRSAKLASGINEGVYIAMSSHSVKYRLQALLTPWGPAVMFIILCTNAPNSIQTLANLGFKTAGVYVRNNSTALVFDTYSYYNVSVPEAQQYFANLDFAIGVLAKMTAFRSSATSTVVGHGNAVATSLVRDGYLGATVIVLNDVTNALERLETVVTITSTCTIASFSGLLSDAVPATPTAVNLTQILPSLNFATAFIYDVAFEVLSPNAMLFQSSLSEAVCQADTCTTLDPNTNVSSTTTTCSSVLVVQDQDIIYTVGTDSVTPVRLVSNATTVSVSDLGNLMLDYARSVETTPESLSSFDYRIAVLNQYSNFPTGSFGDTQSNVLHTKLCASSSLALNYLWSAYGFNASLDPAQAAALNGLTGNAFKTYDEAVPLYNIVQLTYISTANIAVIAGVITGTACLVSLVGIFFAVTSRVNVKPATDSSLLYNADPALVARKQAFVSELSNDPDGQLALEFSADSVLYCREYAVKYPNPADPGKYDHYCRVNISYDNEGAEPEKSKQYY